MKMKWNGIQEYRRLEETQKTVEYMEYFTHSGEKH
jgi:hypothetical protein